MTYLWPHGVDEKSQSGLEPAAPHRDPKPLTATPMFFHAAPFRGPTPGLRTADLGYLAAEVVGSLSSFSESVYHHRGRDI